MNPHDKLFLALLAGALMLLPGHIPAQDQTDAGQQQVASQQTEEELEYTEEEYDAYEKATTEPDLDKRATMLLAYLDKYPESKLQTYIVTAYETLLFEYQKNQNWSKLETLAENWLKYGPDDLQTIAYIAESAQRLGNHQKYIEYGLKIHAQKPSAGLTYHLQQSYRKAGDEAKYFEWTQKLFSYPEFDGDFGLRMEFVQKFAKEKNFDKCAEYARLALQSLEVSKKPDGTPEVEWRKRVTETRRASNYLIGMHHYDKERWAEAIKSLQRALSAERFAAGYYYIGLSQWKLDLVEDAMLSFAKAELLKGELSAQAKDKLEQLYKALHNNTTIGIEKVYRKATTELKERSAQN